jgi:DNA polymerase III epsilon subunit-like protein
MEKYLSSFQNTELTKGEYKNFKIEYNLEQLRFINSPLENSKLLGIPGGGKTASIIGKIIHHYTHKELSAKDQFLILTFSRRACNDFLEKGRKQNKILFTTKNIKTLHSLAGKIVYKALEKKSSSQDTIILSSIDIIDTHPNEIKEMDDIKNLKVIFVDEAQDISFIQYQLILKISKLTNCAVIMIGDPNQNIYQFQNGSDEFLLNHPGQTYILIQNYRSTPHLVEFINHFRPWETLTDKMISTKDINHPFNKKPTIFNGTIEEVIKDIIEKILISPYPREEIAIIGPVKKSKPTFDTYTNIGLSLFTNLLNKYDIKFIKHYEDTKNEEEVNNDIKRVKDYVNLMTIHGAKGLEFHQVFLINFHTSTFGIIPTESKYKEFKYLWYVGLSRACYDLHIYVDKKKLVWNELKSCPNNLYLSENYKPQFVKELKFQEEIQPIYFSVTDILNSKKMMSDETLFNLENIFKYNITTIPIFESFDIKQIKNYKEYSSLYGIFIENVFHYFFQKRLNKVADFITKSYKIINNTIVLPKELLTGYKILKIRCPFIKNSLIKLSNFSIVKNLFKKSEEEVYSYLCQTLSFNYQKEFFLDCHNDVINYSKEDILQSINLLLNSLETNSHPQFDSKIILNNIFKITIFFYQMNNETAYLWNINFDEELKDLEYYIKYMKKFIDTIDICEEFLIHPFFQHPKIAIVGELDLLSNNKIIDIKFSNNLNIKHIIQVLLYNLIINPNMEKEYQLELWNFQLGNRYIININRNQIPVFQIMKILSRSIGRRLVNMIFLYDLETTGLAYANKKIDIIERHFEEYTTKIVPSTGLLKPINVPHIPFEITKLTGITKDMVYEKGQSFEVFKKEISDLLEYCKNPIFIAHNGNSFDHKLLIDKGIFSYDKCKLLDSRIIIRLFLNDPISDKKLSDIFQYLFKFKPIVHRAHSDVSMLISIFEKLNITEEKILNIQ